MNYEKHFREINYTEGKIEEYRRRYYWQAFQGSQSVYDNKKDLILAENIKALAEIENAFGLQFFELRRDKKGNIIEVKPKMSRHYMIEFYPCDNHKHSRFFERVVYDLNLATSFCLHNLEFDEDLSYCPCNVDLDEYVKKCRKIHGHMVVSFPSAKSFTAVAKLLQIDCKWCLPCASLRDALLYLIHDGYADKIQYDRRNACICSVHNNMMTDLLEDKRDFDIFDRLNKLDDYLNNHKYEYVSISSRSFREFLMTNNLKCFLNPSYRPLMVDMLKEHNNLYSGRRSANAI